MQGNLGTGVKEKMDIISKAMDKGLHICENINVEKQTWELFESNREGKQVFVFGTGGGLGYFLRNCSQDMDIVGVIDNDKNKQGQKLGWCSGDAEQTKYAELLIQSPDILNTYSSKGIVVLITSVNVYLPIVAQLEVMGIENYYILLMLEANRRKDLGCEAEENDEKIRNGYIDWCCQQDIQRNKIVMMIGMYGDHARQITNVLLKEKSDLDIVWVVYNENVEKPEGVRVICDKNWRRYYYEMETAQIWLYDDIIAKSVRKREGQIYIQVKHWSSITLKMFYLDDISSCISAEIEDAIKYDGARMDYLFSGSEFDENSCRSGFGFKGKAIRIGSPRSDVLFDKKIRKKVLERFQLKNDAKICLYVPTYRQKDIDSGGNLAVALDMRGLLNALERKWDGNWFLFVRLHPTFCMVEDDFMHNENIMNVGKYPDSEELVAASDVMITDYSSIMFEEAYLKKPVFLYAPDKNEYIDGERGLLLDYSQLPFPIAESNSELHQYIMGFGQKEYEEKVTEFLNGYGVHEDGHASERAAEFIRGLLVN